MTFRTSFTIAALVLTAAFSRAQVPATPTTPRTPATPLTPATEQTPATPATERAAGNDEQNQNTQPYTPYRAKQILGSAVSVQGGEKVGTVDDIVFNQDGEIEYMIVTDGNNKLVTVPWQAANFDLNTRTAQLSVTTDKYRTAPSYDANTYPQFYTPAYRTEVYRSYGLTPREMRRLLPRRR